MDSEINKQRNGQLPKDSDHRNSSMPSPPLYDLTILHSMGREDSSFVKNLIAIFIDSMPESVAEIRRHAVENSTEKVMRDAHKMKSSIELLGIHSLAGTIKALEHADEQNGSMMTHIDVLENTINSVIAELQHLIN